MALPVHDESTYPMTLEKLLKSLLQCDDLQEALESVLFVYDRRLFLSNDSSNEDKEPDFRLKFDLFYQNIQICAEMQLKSIESALRNLNFHIDSMRRSLELQQSASAKGTHNFQLLQESFRYDMMVLKSIPVHPAFIRNRSTMYRTKSQSSQLSPYPVGSNNAGFGHLKGHPFLIDHVDEESLDRVVQGASAHISRHKAHLDSYSSAVSEILEQAAILSNQGDHKLQLKIQDENNGENVIVKNRNKVIRVLCGISSIQSDIAQISPLKSEIESSLTALTQYYRPLLSAHRLPVAYGTTLVEIVRRKEFNNILVRLCNQWSQSVNDIRTREERRRNSFMSQIGIYVPPELVSCVDHNVPIIEISVVNSPRIDRSIFSDLSRTDLEKFQKDLSRIRINMDTSSSKQQDCLASNSLFKLLQVLNEMTVQLDSMPDAFDRQFAKSNFIQKYSKFANTELTDSSTSDRPDDVAQVNYRNSDDVNPYQARIQTLERLLKEKYNNGHTDTSSVIDQLSHRLEEQYNEIDQLKRENEYFQRRLEMFCEAERIETAIQTSQTIQIDMQEDTENHDGNQYEYRDRRSKSPVALGQATSTLSFLLKQTRKSRPSTPRLLENDTSSIIRRKSLLKTPQRSAATTILCIQPPCIIDPQNETTVYTRPQIANERKQKKKRKFSIFLPFIATRI